MSYVSNNKKPTLITVSGLTYVPQEKLELESIFNTVALVLNEKEKYVIERRFAIDGKPKETLESIGQKYDVTRERIRQIEKNALKKLQRVYINTNFVIIAELAKEILHKNAGLMEDDILISEIIKYATTSSKLDKNIINLVLSLDKEISKIPEKDMFKKSFYLNKIITESDIEKVLNLVNKVLRNNGDIMDTDTLLAKVQDMMSEKGEIKSTAFILACMKIDKRLIETNKGWGLSTWRHVNPKSLRDKAYIVLKNNGKPMHFTEICNAIIDMKFDKKNVTTQAVHNELIKSDIFVLIGRGIYALREWGYNDGTVEDVIIRLLEKAGRPMTKKEIIEGVMKERDVQEGTITLNLQKSRYFTRVDRGIYKLSDLYLKEKSNKKNNK